MTTYAVHGSEYDVTRFVRFCRRFDGFTATVYNLEDTFYAAGELPLPDGRAAAIIKDHRLNYDADDRGPKILTFPQMQ